MSNPSNSVPDSLTAVLQADEVVTEAYLMEQTTVEFERTCAEYQEDQEDGCVADFQADAQDGADAEDVA